MSDSHLEAILKTTEDLVRFRSTVNRPEELQRCADYIVDFFKDTNVKVKTFESNGLPLILVTKTDAHPKVLLSGHIDVVEGETEQFEPRIEEGKMYARGAMDMKSGVATMMHLMKDSADTDIDVGLLITADEEVGGVNGVGYALNTLGITCEVVLIPDGGTAVHKLVIKEKGIIRITLKAEGTSAHSAYLWRGESAIHKLRKALAHIEQLFIPLEDHPEDHWVSTCNIGEISGGTAFNVVPKYAYANCDIRIIETDTPEEILKKIDAVLPEGVTYDIQHQNPAAYNQPDHPLMLSFAEAVREHGRVPEFMSTHGASDGRYFTPHNIPVIMCQPDGGNLHEDNEWVSIEGIELFYKVVQDYLQKVALLSTESAKKETPALAEANLDTNAS